MIEPGEKNPDYLKKVVISPDPSLQKCNKGDTVYQVYFRHSFTDCNIKV